MTVCGSVIAKAPVWKSMQLSRNEDMWCRFDLILKTCVNDTDVDKVLPTCDPINQSDLEVYITELNSWYMDLSNNTNTTGTILSFDKGYELTLREYIQLIKFPLRREYIKYFLFMTRKSLVMSQNLLNQMKLGEISTVDELKTQLDNNSLLYNSTEVDGYVVPILENGLFELTLMEMSTIDAKLFRRLLLCMKLILQKYLNYLNYVFDRKFQHISQYDHNYPIIVLRDCIKDTRKLLMSQYDQTKCLQMVLRSKIKENAQLYKTIDCMKYLQSLTLPKINSCTRDENIMDLSKNSISIEREVSMNNDGSFGVNEEAEQDINITNTTKENVIEIIVDDDSDNEMRIDIVNYNSAKLIAEWSKSACKSTQMKGLRGYQKNKPIISLSHPRCSDYHKINFTAIFAVKLNINLYAIYARSFYLKKDTENEMLYLAYNIPKAIVKDMINYVKLKLIKYIVHYRKGFYMNSSRENELIAAFEECIKLYSHIFNLGQMEKGNKHINQLLQCKPIVAELSLRGSKIHVKPAPRHYATINKLPGVSQLSNLNSDFLPLLIFNLNFFSLQTIFY